MSKFIALTVLAAAVLVGALADYAPPKYHAPAPAPSYHAPAPAYHAPAPSYHAPAPSYHSAPVKCGANLLVGCAPTIAHVPCVPSHGGGYGGHGHSGGYHRSADSESLDQMD
ncbi:vitelline membrane protein 15a-1-like [Malaya genurostris]|uniref:vitelline membrane protein 15a-1-like n=1 Tax=Malaya genurostris TaxID=325434 RepID=UPI0026F404A6|nr:vitelline membrane protein 15a-1-like [Malaya genurostris]